LAEIRQTKVVRAPVSNGCPKLFENLVVASKSGVVLEGQELHWMFGIPPELVVMNNCVITP
jgi:hypothetical protein